MPRFASFNLFNLQLPGEPTYPGTRPYTRAGYQRKIEWTARLLERLDADVIGFQELWSREALVDAFTAAGLEDDYTLITEDTPQHRVSVALAHRKDFRRRNTAWYPELPDACVIRKRRDDAIDLDIDFFSRPPLRVVFTPPDTDSTLAVYVAHLKSKRPTPLDAQERNRPEVRRHSGALGSAISTIRRTAEAAGLRILLSNYMRNNENAVVVLGDLNDAQLSNTLDIITEQPALRLNVFSRRGRSSDRGLYSTATLQELRSLRDVYYTHIYQGIRETLDHILVSEQFYDYSTHRVWEFAEMGIFNDHLVDTLVERRESRTVSDHGIPYASFRLRA